MADWLTVRHDPSYPEPLDAEIVPLCDALNAAGFTTTTSCCGHGTRWPYVCFDDSNAGESENLARFVMMTEECDHRPHFTMWQREVLPGGCRWSVHVHLNDVYGDTPAAEALERAIVAINATAAAVQRWDAAA